MLTRQKEISDLANCSYHNWYETFRKHCIKSVVIPIPPNVLKYLKDEFFILPKECSTSSSEEGSSSSSATFVGEESNFDDDDTETCETPEFPEFSKLISETLENLGGSAFIKTNWHCPRDSIWITAGQTLRVRDLADTYQLLKASSTCKDDLNEIDDDGFAHLILKKWKEVHPGTEFRCFVRQRNLIAISPRDWPQYHEHFKTQKRDIIKDIVSLFREKIKDKFPTEDFCFDVIRSTKDHVTIVDFSPFNEKYTQSLAFDWSQLKSDELIENCADDPDNPEFRYLNSDVGIQPTTRNNCGIPQDVIDMFKSNSTSQELSDDQLMDMNLLLIDRMQHETNDNDD